MNGLLNLKRNKKINQTLKIALSWLSSINVYHASLHVFYYRTYHMQKKWKVFNKWQIFFYERQEQSTSFAGIWQTCQSASLMSKKGRSGLQHEPYFNFFCLYLSKFWQADTISLSVLWHWIKKLKMWWFSDKLRNEKEHLYSKVHLYSTSAVLILSGNVRHTEGKNIFHHFSVFRFDRVITALTIHVSRFASTLRLSRASLGRPAAKFENLCCFLLEKYSYV